MSTATQLRAALEDRTARDAVLAAVPAALAVMLGVVPLLLLLVESIRPIPTAEHYRAVTEEIYFDVIVQSLFVGVLLTLICLAVAYPVTYWLANHCPGRYRLPVLAALTLPLWLNYVVLNYTWVWLLTPKGVINVVLGRLGLVSEPLRLLGESYALPVVDLTFPSLSLVLGFVHIYLPYVLLTMYVSMERLDYRLVEAAQDLGAGNLRVFRDVIVPETVAGAVAGLLIVYARIAGAYATPRILGADSNPMVAELITTQYRQVLDDPFASALSMTFLAIVVVGFAAGARSSRIRTELKQW
jgi:ABC-type spermidine/putrescine transport system permease subunit I